MSEPAATRTIIFTDDDGDKFKVTCPIYSWTTFCDGELKITADNGENILAAFQHVVSFREERVTVEEYEDQT